MNYFPLERETSQSVLKCNNTVYCGNKWDYNIVFPTWICYIVLSIVFLVAYNDFIIENYSIGLVIFSYFLSLPGIYFAVKCFSTDPGILKRGDLAEPEDEAEENDNPHPSVQDNQMIDSPKDSNEEIKNNSQEQPLNQEETNDQQQQQGQIELQQDNYEGTTNGYLPQVISQIQMEELKNKQDQQIMQKKQRGNLLKQRYCKTCKIMRPPLASHCSHCNNCVKNYDHHCFFMGNCIGERNQKHFVLFLLFTAIWAFYVETFVVLNTIEAIKLYDNIIQDIYYNNYLFVPFCVITGLTAVAIFIRCHQCIKGWLILAFIFDVAAITLYTYLENRDIPFQDNPIVQILMCGVYLGVILFVLPQACFNTELACKHTTLKQEHFYAQSQSMESQSASFANLWKLLTKPQTKSEILSQ